MLDFHSHLMPGVDDGANDLEEARTGLQTMQQQGIRTIVTTPHIRASQTVRDDDVTPYLARLDKAFSALLELVLAEFQELRLDRGVEMMLDIPNPRLEDSRLRLAGSNFVLVEFPFMNIPPNSTEALRHIRIGECVPVIAHPERYGNMSRNIRLLEDWRDAGAWVQVNSGSLVGQYGANARRLAWYILERGWADYLSSDYHSRGRCSVRQAVVELEERGGKEQLQLLTVTNPERMLRSDTPLPVPPLEEVQLGFWKKLFR